MSTQNPKILVHACCAACASHVFSQLRKDGFTVYAYFYNPQIDDRIEYEKRLTDLSEFCLENGYKLLESVRKPADFLDLIKPYKDRESIKYISDKDRFQRRRCNICNTLIMQKTIEQAKKNKLKFFTTTLLCSPYKDHEELISLGNEKSLDYGVNFYYADFRKGYWMGRNYARNHEIYIPGFCGCSDSQKERRLE